MSGYAVFSYDYYGHGRSDGKNGYIDDVAKWADHAEAFIRHIQSGAPFQPLPTKYGKEQEKDKQRRTSIPIKNDNMREFMQGLSEKPWIIHGDAIGGAFGLIISTRLPDFNIIGLTLTGVFVLLPSDTHALLQKVAGVASQLMPTSPVASVDLYKRCHSESEIQQYIDDPLTRKANMRARVGYGIMMLSKTIVELLPSVTVPFITLHGSEDWYCDVEGAKLLHDKAKSTDKTIHVFDGFYHDLLHELCSESMINELMIWINKRAPK
jgi:alpha-beta hydrolase superfamily lysophospholipase